MIPNEITIDLGALRDNFAEIRALAGPGTQVLAVVKSDAYGHGMVPVARTLEAAGVDHLAVFEIEEGVALRRAGCRLPILIMMGITSEEIPVVIEEGLTPALYLKDTAERLSGASLKQGKVTPVHLKVDTGMSRLGVFWQYLEDFLQQLVPLKGIQVEGIFTHLAVADMPNRPFTESQIGRLQGAVEACRRIIGFKGAVHVSNSGALLAAKGLHFDMVRPGILLYGCTPSEGWPKAGAFKPVMSFKSRVVQVKKVPPDTPVSYGSTYVTQGECTIATVPVGYDDGFNRLLSNKGEVLIRGRRAPVLGRVCMNLTMVDATGIEGADVGDEVVLLGTQGDEQITADDIAGKIGTINYEVCCALGKSNRRVYIAP